MGKHNPKYVDAQNFSQNASELLLDGGRLEEFFETLDHELTPNRHGDGYLALCPVCESSNCLVGLNGSRHRIWWRCLSKSCPAGRDDFGTPRNLLSLVKHIVGGQGEAIAMIADFLGYAGRSFDITNGKFRSGDQPEEQESTHDYVWLVPDGEMKALFDEAGVEAMVYRGRLPEGKVVYSLIDDEDVPADGGRFDPLEWDYLPPDEVRRKALAAMWSAADRPSRSRRRPSRNTK